MVLTCATLPEHLSLATIVFLTLPGRIWRWNAILRAVQHGRWVSVISASLQASRQRVLSLPSGTPVQLTACVCKNRTIMLPVMQ